MSIARQLRLLSIALAVVGSISPNTASADDSASKKDAAWSFDALVQQVQHRATRPFEPSPALPPKLRNLDYDNFRLIQFEHAEAIWKGTRSPFALECFHRGYIFNQKVVINLVENGRTSPLPFERKLFQYRGKLSDLTVPDDLGFAGFRVLGRFESSRNMLELASFLGASYFRAIGEGQVYGTSARGLAVDIGLPKVEEFPVFREFWIERPQRDARSLKFWALLDSPKMVGAYEFTLRPGKATVFDVKARLFFRRHPDKIGLAPMTSMWSWGDGRQPSKNDPRPHVHDCDGLLVQTQSNEWIWRPLSIQSYPSVSRFECKGIRGFGLLQRERRPESYLDNEAKYHLRPSVWIQPKAGWSDGAVELLELPAAHEGIDNIAAWWKPNKPVQVGTPLDLEYSVAFMPSEPEHAVARATATRVQRREGQPIHVEIDFAGDRVARLAADAKLECEIKAQRGAVSNIRCEKQSNGSWRVSFDVRPTGKEPVELRASLSNKGEALTETWRYLCPI